MRLIHCNGDDNVTYENSQVAYDYFIEGGAENVDLIDGGDFNHLECASLAILAAKLWIDSMADLCEPTNLRDTEKINKNLIKTTDILGRQLKGNDNKILIKIYDDGSVQKVTTLQR